MPFGRIKLPHKILLKEAKTMSDNIIQLTKDLIKHDLRDLDTIFLNDSVFYFKILIVLWYGSIILD